jgi:hypothetical protein
MRRRHTRGRVETVESKKVGRKLTAWGRKQQAPRTLAPLGDVT